MSGLFKPKLCSKVGIRLSNDERDQAESKAHAKGISLSAFIRRAIIRALGKTGEGKPHEGKQISEGTAQ